MIPPGSGQPESSPCSFTIATIEYRELNKSTGQDVLLFVSYTWNLRLSGSCYKEVVRFLHYINILYSAGLTVPAQAQTLCGAGRVYLRCIGKSRRKVNGGVWEDGGKGNVAEMCGKKTVREFY